MTRGRQTTGIDPVTIAGLALLLMPVLTMAHEVGGHAVTCAALGFDVKEIGAFYVDCDGGGIGRRLVAAAGPAVDLLVALSGYQAWRRLRGDFSRLVVWYVWLSGAFDFAGYFAFSGLTGIGDLNPGEGGGIGPLPFPLLWRALFLFGGGFAYWRLIVIGGRQLSAMIGQGLGTRTPRRTVAHLFYGVFCVTGVIVGLFNPVGLVITLTSAAASTFGGKAGLISIGFATVRDGASRPFTIRRSWAILFAGILATGAFAALLGPSITF